MSVRQRANGAAKKQSAGGDNTTSSSSSSSRHWRAQPTWRTCFPPAPSSHSRCSPLSSPTTAPARTPSVRAPSPPSSSSCFLASFTDTVRASDGRVYHGLATLRGLWLFDSDPASTTGLPDLTRYRLRLIDCVHALLVFSAVALRDKNVVACYYPEPPRETRQVLDTVPLGIGLLCSLLFVVFPTTRHGIGFPVTPAPK